MRREEQGDGGGDETVCNCPPRSGSRHWSPAHLRKRRPSLRAQGQGPAQVNTIKDVFQKLSGCWKPPPLSAANPMDITVIVSFNRAGGNPRPSQDHL